MNNKIAMMRLLTSMVLLVASAMVFNACSKDEEPVPVHTITGFSPTSAVQGATVVITGANFNTMASKNVVTFNGTAAVVTEATSSQLTTTVPAGTTTGKITVQIGTNTITSTDDFVYIPTTTVSTLAGGVSGYADGTGASAKLEYPTGVATDASGNLYVADWNNNRIRKITADGVTTTIAGGVDHGSTDGPVATALLNGAYGLASDASGTIYVADTYNHSIRKITTAGVVSTLAGSTDGYADGTGTAAKFSYPLSVAVDNAGNVYVADIGNRIRKITPGGVVTTLAGNGTKGFSDGTGTAAFFNNPNSVAVDASGNVFVADTDNHRIRKITPAGVVTTLAGSTSGSADGTGTAAQFKSPSGVSVDASGNLYVADRFNNKVRKVTSGGVVTTLAGNAAGFADGIGAVAQFKSLQGVTVTTSGIIYVADSENNRIRKITIK